MKAMKLAVVVVLAAGFGRPALSAEHATKDECVALVKKAIEYVKKEGVEKAYAAFDKKGGEFTDRDLYIYVQDMSGRTLAHGANVKLIGKDMHDAQDVDGKYYVRERLALASKQSSFWQDYKFSNPMTKKIEFKEAYCERLAETLVCSGVYKQ